MAMSKSGPERRFCPKATLPDKNQIMPHGAQVSITEKSESSIEYSPPVSFSYYRSRSLTQAMQFFHGFRKGTRKVIA